VQGFLNRSKVTGAKKGTISLRSTIPATVVQALGVEFGDELIWEVTAKDNKFLVVVRKA